MYFYNFSDFFILKKNLCKYLFKKIIRVNVCAYSDRSAITKPMPEVAPFGLKHYINFGTVPDMQG